MTDITPNKANSHSAHGAPLGEDEIKLTKQAYGWPEDEKFLVPEQVRQHFAEGVGARGKQQYADWSARFAEYKTAHPQDAAELETLWAGGLPADWDKDIPVQIETAKTQARADRLAANRAMSCGLC